MFRTFFRLMPYAHKHRGALSAIIGMSLAASAVGVLQPWPIKILVDYALREVAPPDWLHASLSYSGLTKSPLLLIVVAGLSSLLLFAINSALDVGLSWAWMAAGQSMVYELAGDVFSRLQGLTLRYHSRSSVGDKLDRLTTDSWCVYSIVNSLLVTPLQRGCTVVAVGVVAWCLDPWLTILSFVVSPVLAVSVWFFGPRLKRRAKRSREAHARLTSFVHQTVTSIPLVQAFSAEARNQTHFAALVDEAVAASQEGVLVDKSFALVNGLANTTALAMVIFAGGQRVLDGTLTVGSLLVFLAYIRTLQGGFRQLLEVYSKLRNAEASLERITEVLDEEDEIRESPDARSLPRTGPSASIEFDQVTFGYERDRPVLRDVSLSIRAGECVALVGSTGAGKSTLAALIPRFIDPWTGTVSINGVDLRIAKLDSVRCHVATVSQEPYLLPLSVAETISYGCPTASREAIVQAAKAAQADEFIRKLAHGYDTVLGQRGTTLSGGQKQRLAIARALAMDAAIVILDEPTSALDAQTETKLMRAIEQLTANRTTLIIAHRLSTVRQADRILVLEQGRIVESGTHSELLALRGAYAAFCAAHTGSLAEAVA